MGKIVKNKQYYKFCFYGFLKNLRFFDAFFILFLIDRGLSFTLIGLLYATREIVTNIFEVPSGIIADTFGRKKSLVASFLIYICSFILFYFATKFAVFAVAFVLFGIAAAFRSGTHKGIIMDYLAFQGWEKLKINYYGHTRAWSQLGSGISALVAGIIVFYSGSYENIFLYSVVPYLLNLILLLSYPESLNKTQQAASSSWWAEMIKTVKALYSSLKNLRVLNILNTTAFHSAYLKAIKDYIQPLMVNVAVMVPVLVHTNVEKKNGVIIGVIYFLLFLCTSFASKTSSRFVERKKNSIALITLFTGFLFGIICGIFYHYELWVISLLAFIAIFIVENIRKPILTGFMADEVSNKNLTSIFSALSLWQTIVTSVLAVAVGFLSDGFGIGIALFIVSLVLVLFTLLSYVVSRNRKL